MDEIIKKLISEELQKANSKFPQFQSRHEAYAVMLEEFEEAKKEFEDIQVGIEYDYWEKCRNSKTTTKEETIFLLECLENAIICNIKELLQLGAMIKKSRNLEIVKKSLNLEEVENEEENS